MEELKVYIETQLSHFEEVYDTPEEANERQTALGRINAYEDILAWLEQNHG